MTVDKIIPASQCIQFAIAKDGFITKPREADGLMFGRQEPGRASGFGGFDWLVL